MYKKMFSSFCFIMPFLYGMEEDCFAEQRKSKLTTICVNAHAEALERRKSELKIDSPEKVAAYIHCTLFMYVPEEIAHSVERITLATLVAQKVCPKYSFWSEYFQAIGRGERGKFYSAQESVELVLAPIMHKIVQLKREIGQLKGQECLEPIDWEKETDALQLTVKDKWGLISLMERALPVKQAELSQLKEELAKLSQPEVLKENLVSKNVALQESRSQFEKVQNELHELRLVRQNIEKIKQQFLELRRCSKSLSEHEVSLHGLYPGSVVQSLIQESSIKDALLEQITGHC